MLVKGGSSNTVQAEGGFVFRTRANKATKGAPTTRRRSSLALRGARPSLALNGLPVVPHTSIDPGTYYAHMQGDQPDPVKLKQLLVWVMMFMRGSEQHRFRLRESERLLKGGLPTL
jgi:hypothetical protein